MFVHFQTFIFITSIGSIIAQSVVEDFVISKNKSEQICLICQEKLPEHDEDDNEYGKAMGFDSLDDIENEILLINSTVWLQNASDSKDWKNEIAKFHEVYETLEYDEANKQFEALKTKENAFATEKDMNKRNALKKWHRLPIIRLRIHKIEKNFLDNGSFGDNISAFQHMDSLRNSINEISKVLQEIYNYYKQMDDELSESYKILTEIQQQLKAKREKDHKARRSKCFFIFC